MICKRKKEIPIPTMEQVQEARKRERYRRVFRKSIVTTISVLIVVAAVAVLVASLFLPVVRVVGDSMEPNLSHDDMLLLVKTEHYEPGGLCCFYYQNRLLIKRVIGLPGDIISIDPDGTVFVNGEALDEPYVINKSLGQCDIAFPYQVPENRVFVLGDHRETSVDSRSSVIGSVETERIVGQVILRFWPMEKFEVLS